MKSGLIISEQGRLIEEALYVEDAEKAELESGSTNLGKELDDILAKGGEKLAGLRESLCFLDVVLVLPGTAGKYSRGFVLTPDRKTGNVYADLIEKEMLAADADVAGHPVFAAGLPLLWEKGAVDPLEISTQAELVAAKQRDSLDRVRPRFFHRSFGHSPAAGDSKTPLGQSPSFAITPWTFTRGTNDERYGGPTRSVLENIQTFEQLLAKRATMLPDSSGRPLASLTGFPLVYWCRSRGGRLWEQSGGSFFLGLSSTPDDKTLTDWASELQRHIRELASAGFLLRESEGRGQEDQRFSFAHQTSAIIDSIVKEFEKLPAETLKSLGSTLMARLYLLRATIDSYREGESLVDVGDFPYPWVPEQEPLAVYRDIGLQLGMARALNAPEREIEVKNFGGLLTDPRYKFGTPGFDLLRNDYFAQLPATKEAASPAPQTQ